MEIHIPPIQSEQCTFHIHKANEANIVATLRKLGLSVILYLDDMLVTAPMKKEVRKHLATALELLIALGFVINMKKSVARLDQVMEFLGFVLDSNIG